MSQIVGMDEVGRGAWAGPLLVVAAVLKPAQSLPEGLRDSKKLTKAKRIELAKLINSECEIGQGWVSAREIDELGMTRAMILACEKALKNIRTLQSDATVLLDGKTNYLKDSQYSVVTLIDGDDKEPIISAASIVAKVLRDEYMRRLDESIIGYEFAHHVGYGTALHRAKLAELGVSAQHRTSFRPIASMQNGVSDASKTAAKNSSGAVGEKIAATHLEYSGYTILAKNWRTKACEIDIVAEKHGVVYLVEVKTRSSAQYGSPFEYITVKKQLAMKKAAEFWLAYHPAHDAIRLAAVSVDLSTDAVEFVEVL